MKAIHFATTNQEKIQIAQTICSTADIVVNSVALEIDEIQGEDPEAIVRDKAQRAYEQLGMPVVVSDDSWDIRALRGFPGAYMKSINYWFRPDDFLRLMNGVEDRRITLHQHLAYTDGNVTRVFKNDITGKIIEQARGENKKSPSMTITALDTDDGKTLAEVFEQNPEAIALRGNSRPDVWHEFINWYNKT